MKTFFVVDKRITIGELMTVISIVFSAISVLITWRNEQKLQILENATRTRIELAKTLNTIDQVIQIQLSFYELIEEDIVEVSRIAVVERETTKARDYMWEKFYRHRAEILNIISQNEWEVAYTNLLTYGISSDSIYIKTVARLKKLQDNQFNLALRAFEKEIIDFRSPNNQTNLLIDRLRYLKKTFREEHLDYSKKAIDELNVFCLELIKKTDQNLIFKKG